MPIYDIMGKGKWVLEGDVQIVAFTKDSWEFIKEILNPGQEFDNKGRKKGYLCLPDALSLEIYSELRTTKVKQINAKSKNKKHSKH